MPLPSPCVFDCFLFHNELDILECRLEELSSVVDRFVLVECGETHQGTVKPSHYLAAKDRFVRWSRQIKHVWIPRLTNTDPEAREHEQREGMRAGLVTCGALPNDIVLQSDVDEIPRATVVSSLHESLRSDRPLLTFDQTLHCFAVDWQYPGKCEMAPAAARLADIGSFWTMRNASARSPRLPNGGWHFSWLGDTTAHLAKLDAIYEGPSIDARVRPMLAAQQNWRDGVHVDGVRMAPIDIDVSFPGFIHERRCPENWFRPREGT